MLFYINLFYLQIYIVTVQSKSKTASVTDGMSVVWVRGVYSREEDCEEEKAREKEREKARERARDGARDRVRGKERERVIKE